MQILIRDTHQMQSNCKCQIVAGQIQQNSALLVKEVWFIEKVSLDVNILMASSAGESFTLLVDSGPS